MKRKFLVGLLAIVSVFALAFGLAACGSDNGGNSTGDKWGDVYTIEAAYAEAVNLGYSGTLEEFIESISGKDGADGKSAYDIWLGAGHEGAEEDFLAWLKGEDENSQGLDFYPLGDGSTYGVAAGYAKYLDAIEIPSTYRGKPVTTIVDNSFTYSKIKSIVIPDSVTSIDNSAFVGCNSLTSITIPDSVTSIGDYSFNNCSSLTSVTFGKNSQLTSIGYSAFQYCSSLTSVTIGNSVTNIGSYAFYNCSSLTSVTIGNSVTSIGSGAFNGCSSLTSVTIGNSVTSIGSGAFYNCSSLTSITIPNSVTSIGDNAFGGCNSLTSITIPDSVTSIGRYAFSGCSGLTSVTFENTIGWWYSSESTATSGTSISSTDLADPSTAATYLKSTYYYYWKRS